MVKYTGPLARETAIASKSIDTLVSQLAQDLSKLSEEDLKTVAEDVISFFETNSEFVNTCHGPDGRFCETPGTTSLTNPLKGLNKKDQGKLVIGTLRSVWKEKVSTLTKVNIGVLAGSVAGYFSNPTIRNYIDFGTPESMLHLAAGLMVLMWSEGKRKR